MFVDGLYFLFRGGWIMWPLLLCSVMSVTVMIERFISIRRAATDNEALMEGIRRHLKEGQVPEAVALCDRTPGPIASLMASGLRSAHMDSEDIERAMEELALRETPVLYRRLSVLDTIITLAPLLGLLGTITGMIRAFNVVSDVTSAPTAITGGVAEALIATATGLSVAIVTLPVYNYLTERVREIVAEMEARATQLLNLVAQLRADQEAASRLRLAQAPRTPAELYQ